MLIFGIGPLFFYLMYIHPATIRIYGFSETINRRSLNSIFLASVPAAVSDRESKQLDSIKRDHLMRIKKVNNSESLLRFSGMLTDALAAQARLHGLRVIKVNLQSSLIKGSYLPQNDFALDALNKLPSVQWIDLGDPLDLPMLKLPSIEVQMIVDSEYSEVFSFIESLPDFPVRVLLTGLETVNDSQGKGFCLKIHGYYFNSIEQKSQQLQSS
jgi:hypothetical protein